MTFEDAHASLAYINGWLSEPEARLLWDAARLTDGPMLEVGAYYGRSTILLARLTGTAGKLRQVCSVDPFGGFDDRDPTGDFIHRSLLLNLDNRSIANVEVFRMRIEEWEPRPCGFAYLDGDHSHDGTLNQIKVARQCNPQAIAAHDVNDAGEGLAIKRACLELLGMWDQRVERLAVWRMKS